MNDKQDPSTTAPEPTTRTEWSEELTPSSDRRRLRPTRAARDRVVPGSVLGGQYEVFDVKSGGMGRVYLADDLDARAKGLALRVAIKTVVDFEEWQAARRLRGGAAEESEYFGLVARFRREAMNWVRLGKHANIILAFLVIDVGQEAYLVMEYANGGDLSTWIKANRIDVPLAVNFGIQFCEGMQYAVRVAGMVHRDIKPANVLIQDERSIKIGDFGLARAYGFSGADLAGVKDSGDPWLSQVGAGTIPYMAPEQFSSLARADTRSDIFSFGAMLFEMVTSQRLFRDRNACDMSMSRDSLPLAHAVNPDVPSALSALISRAVAYGPAERYPSFEKIAADLKRIDESLPHRIPVPSDPTALPAAFYSASVQVLGETYSLICLGLSREAAQRAEEGIRIDPKNAEHWINKGKALGDLRDFAAAEPCFVRATQLSPDSAHAWANLGWARHETGDSVGGLQAAEQAIVIDSEFADAWICCGCCKRTLGSHVEAVDALRRATGLEPHNWKAHANLGFCLADMERRSDALAALRRAAALNPDAPLVWYFIAWLLAAEGNAQEARGAIDRSLQLAATDADAWGLRAVILLQSEGDVAGARQCVERALALDPLNQKAKAVLDALPNYLS